MIEIILAVLVLAAVAMLAVMLARGAVQAREIRELSGRLSEALEAKHRGMLVDLHNGLTQQGDRLGGHLTESSERLRGSVAEELKQTRDTLHAMKLSMTENMNEYREAMLARLTETTQTLNTRIDERLGEISGKVNERLDEGFKKTNETFVSVMSRLATIDEAQKKIESLTGSVVSLQELLGDKRARGAFGEVQLESLVRNVMPAGTYEMQCTLSNGTRADCVLKLPAPTGKVAVDSKFPLENYHRMFAPGTSELERASAQKQFRLDLRRHIEAISTKYIISGETSDGAVMFVPAEAVFAEIHAHHGEVVDFANNRRVWIVSPTTLMAVLNTARAVLKDVETRRQVHVIKECLTRLAVEFSRFDERMRDLARHIRQAHEDVEKVQVTSSKISQRFAQIEGVELGELEPGAALRVVELRDEGKG
ncbi:MAG TPA: DNA recombination protein RmuC [Burkholderiales bacterium]|jgi:DNA recombination protein RmuC|nr:DNA recombination protein RmuC [Burkholderiales bacterium]